MIAAYDGGRRANPNQVEKLGSGEQTAEIICRATDASPLELVPFPYPQGLDESHIHRLFLSGGLITLRDLEFMSSVAGKRKVSHCGILPPG